MVIELMMVEAMVKVIKAPEMMMVPRELKEEEKRITERVIRIVPVIGVVVTIRVVRVKIAVAIRVIRVEIAVLWDIRVINEIGMVEGAVTTTRVTAVRV